MKLDWRQKLCTDQAKAEQSSADAAGTAVQFASLNLQCVCTLMRGSASGADGVAGTTVTAADGMTRLTPDDGGGVAGSDEPSAAGCALSSVVRSTGAGSAAGCMAPCAWLWCSLRVTSLDVAASALGGELV